MSLEREVLELHAEVKRLKMRVEMLERPRVPSSSHITRTRIAKMAERKGAAYTTAEIAEMFNLGPGAASQWLCNCWRRGLLERPIHGCYTVAP